MAAYLLVEAIIDDMERFSAYAAAVPAIVTQFGGEYIVLGGEQEVLEGDWGKQRIVMHQWPDLESARAFWQSAEYQAAKKLRQGTGEFKVMLVDGVHQETLE